MKMLRTGLMIRMGMVSSEKVGSRWFLNSLKVG